MDVRVHEADKRMVVVVADDQLSLAIGKGGQNARLAARLTGWKIDLISKSEEKKRQEVDRASRIEIEKLELGEATTEKLISAGIETVHELAATPLERLVEIPGVGEKTAEKMLSAAQEYLAAHPPVAPEAAPAEFTPESEPAGELTADTETADGPVAIGTADTPPAATDAAVTEAPEKEEPATEEPATEQQATEEPATEEPATEAAAGEAPAAESGEPGSEPIGVEEEHRG